MAQFKRRTFHLPNLIPVWVDPNDKVQQFIQTSNLINRTSYGRVQMSISSAFESVKFDILVCNLGRPKH